MRAQRSNPEPDARLWIAWSLSLLAKTGFSTPRRGRTCQPVADGFAQSLMWNGRDCDHIRTRRIERAQEGEEMAGGFCQIAFGREIETGLLHIGETAAEIQNGFVFLDACCIEPQARMGRIMGGEHAWRCHRAAISGRADLMAQHALNFLACNAAGAQQSQAIGQAGNDGRFDADTRGSAIEHHVDPPLQIAHDMQSKRG